MKKTTPLFALAILFLTYLSISSFATSAKEENATPRKKTYIYLTFDDGPLNGSQHVNDAVLTEKIPITVLLVGEHALVRPKDVELYKKNTYIEIGNHSYDHANDHYKLYYSNPEGVLEDFEKNQTLLQLKNKIGRLPGRNMWRVDGRSKNDISSGIKAADLLAKNGFSLFGWDLEWQHNSHTAEPIGTAEDIAKQIETILEEQRTLTEGHFVLLCHDEMFRHGYDESELKKLIELLKDKEDYAFASLTEYP